MMQLSCNHCKSDFFGDGRRGYCDNCQDKKPSLIPPKPRITNCLQCDADISGYRYRSKYCRLCASGRQKTYAQNRKLVENDNEKARMLTKYAVKIGFLPPPSEFQCADCKYSQAECYDHRDYSRPLDVDPVCLRCNSSRGRGIPFIAPANDVCVAA